MKELSPSRSLAAKTLHMAFKVLSENGGELPGREVIKAVGERVDLNDWAREQYKKTGYVRWESILHFFSIDAVKAGFLVKKKGVWYLTTEGEDALKYDEVGLLKAVTTAYKEWRAKHPKDNSSEDLDDDGTEDRVKDVSVALEQIEQIAADGLKTYIEAKNAYEFQDLAAALLRGMGYHTPFVAPRGKDGGVDIIAYRDPLGTVSPRIKVQVKHRQQPANVQEVRQLMGLLQKDGDVGIFISTNGFTPDAKMTALGSHIHMELIDLTRFIDLWQEFYPKLSDEDKAHLPLLPIYFLEPLE